MRRTLTFLIHKEEENTTILKYLLNHNISYRCISAMKTDPAGILVNEQQQYVIYSLKENDLLEVSYNEESDDEKIVPTPMDLDILYEDEDLIVINKPINMTVHPSIKYFTNTLENGLVYYFSNKKEDIRPHCITRLDRDTTGVTLFAKNRFSANVLSQMVANKQIKKTYYAMVEGETEANGTVHAPIGKIVKGSILRAINYETGKDAITHYQLVQYNKENNISLVKINLETGRTHQIRVHMQYIGHPLIGDELYNKSNHQLSRQGLHAYQLEFNHPITAKPLCIQAEIPQDMKALL